MKKYSAYGYLLDTRFNVVGEPTAINADGIAFWLYVGLKWEFMIALFIYLTLAIRIDPFQMLRYTRVKEIL